MTKPTREHRVPIMLNDHELQAIDNWRFTNKVGSRSAAMRRLMLASLKTRRFGLVDVSGGEQMELYIEDHRRKDGTLVKRTEACLMTINGGEDLCFVAPGIPDDQPMSEAATLLSAILFRIKEDPEFLRSMEAYIEASYPESVN
jgi:hypothetical protein